MKKLLLIAILIVCGLMMFGPSCDEQMFDMPVTDTTSIRIIPDSATEDIIDSLVFEF